jgi:hypothetical protein
MILQNYLQNNANFAVSYKKYTIVLLSIFTFISSAKIQRKTIYIINKMSIIVAKIEMQFHI